MPDPAAGKFEMPGGHIESGEAPRQAALREWQEETGLRFPDGEWTGAWTAGDGIYQGFVYTIACEADLDIFDRQIGSDPDGDVTGTETIAWWDPADLPGNPAVRPELLDSIGDVMAALGCTPDDCCGAECCAGGCCDGGGGCTCGTASALPDGNRETCPCGTPDPGLVAAVEKRRAELAAIDRLMKTPPGAAGGQRVRHRTGSDDHLEFGVAKAGGGAAPKGPKLDLGNLTGVWADIYTRREKLLRKHAKAIAAAWDACIAELGSPRDLVQQFRSESGLVAKAADPDRKWWKDTATTAALAWLQRLYQAKGWAALVAAIGDAIRSGMAEGEADALALAADKQGVRGFAIGAAFTAAYDRLAGDASVTQQAQDAAASMVDGAAGDIGSALADQAGDDGSEQDMADAAGEAASGDGSSLGTRLSDMFWSAIGAGALALYSLASQAAASADGTDVTVQVDWLNEPGACPVCEENAANGPYAPEDVPPYLAHPHCRCWLASMQGLPASILASFLS